MKTHFAFFFFNSFLQLVCRSFCANFFQYFHFSSQIFFLNPMMTYGSQYKIRWLKFELVGDVGPGQPKLSVVALAYLCAPLIGSL